MREIPLTAWQMGRVLFQPLILIMSHIHIREAGNRDSFMVMVPGYWKMKI